MACTYLEGKLEAAGFGIAPLSKKLGMRFSTVAMVVRGQMHVTPAVMDRISSAIDDLCKEREAA